MAKQLNVNLSVNADVKQAKAAFEDLQSTLTKIQGTAMASSKNLFNVQEIKAASAAARELQQHLAAATDANTGRLNLSTFSSSLKRSGKDLDAYKIQLEALGPEGEKAFTKVARSIAMADNPLRRTNGLLNEFKTTLMNTARWQISSSILHGFMGALQSAYGYAQDLNQSLNNIRIVTGLNSDEMAKFAEQANKAAKALSTTTTDYTDAALIYYQQGIRDQAEIAARTETTIKLANVSRQSAEEVSSQMTAIWNNFADGSKSLEYYADVITKLGASTASSSQEISAGIEKFASVADTVGLSYEKATAALATVVAETRQSADVVGTAFKTMFARVQGLSLGETLEDGVNLNKYSKALKTVGVDILDANGNLKEMDTILDELGNKWNTIGENQKVALAETVAGTRQYAQFMAIMNNYDKILSNQELAKGSEGTLQQQADVYAESWEAASKRVKAAFETIYGSLLNDKFFIGVNNVIADLLDGVNGFIQGMGGVKGILATVGAFIAQSLAKEAPSALQRINEYLTQITGKAQQTGAAMQTATQQWAAKEVKSANAEFEALDTAGPNASEYMVEVNLIEMLAEKKRQYNQNEAAYSKEERQRAQDEIAGLEAAGNAVLKKAQALDKLRAQADKAQDSLMHMTQNGTARDMISQVRTYSQIEGNMQSLVKQIDLLNTKFANNRESEEYTNALREIGEKARASGQDLGQGFINDLEKLEGKFDMAQISGANFGNMLRDRLSTGAQDAADRVNTLVEQLSSDYNIPTKTIENFVNLLRSVGVEAQDLPKVLDGLRNSFGSLTTHTSKTSEQIMSLSGALMQVNAMISAVTRLKDVFTDEDSTIIEKIGAVIGVVTAAIFTYNAVAKLTATITAAESTSLFASAGAWLAKKFAVDLANKSLATTLAMTGLVALAIAALVAVVWLLVAAFKVIAAASPEGKLKAAKEATEAAGKAAEEAKKAYDDLKASIEGYESAVAKINTLTRGTEEFRKAVEEANDAARELIRTYGLTKFSVDENGVIRLDSNEYSSRKQEYANRVDTAGAASLGAQNYQKSRENVIASRDMLTRAQMYSSMTQYNEGGSYNTNRLLTSANIQKAQTNLGVTDFTGQTIKSVADAMGWNVHQLNDEKQDFINTLLSAGDALEDFGDTLKQNTAAIEADTKAQLAATLATKEEFLNAKDQNAVLAAQMNKKSKTDADINKNIAAMSKDELYSKYAKAMGYSSYGTGGWLDGKERFYNNKGEKVADLTDDVIRAQYAEILSQQGMIDNALAETISTMNSILSGAGNNANVVSSAVQGLGAGNLTYGQSQLSASKFAITDEQAQQIGYDNAQAYQDAIAAVIKEGQDRFEKLKLDEFNLDPSILNQLSVSSGEALRKVYDQIKVGPLGEQAGQDFIEGLNTMLSGLDSEEQGLALNQLMNIDWSSWDAGKQAKKIIEDLGGAVDKVNWESFTEEMRKANLAIPDFSKLKTQLQDVASVLNGLTVGSIIKDDDYQKLIAYNEEWKDFFILQADGKQKFIGDSKEMMKATRENIQAQREDLTLRRQYAEELQNENWGHTDEHGSYVSVDWTDTKSIGNKTGTLQSLMENSGGAEKVLNTLGYNDDILSTYLGNPEKYEEEINKVFDAIATYMSQNYEELDEQMNEVMASTASNMYELVEMQGVISQEAFAKQGEALKTAALDSVQTLAELDGAIVEFNSHGIAVSSDEEIDALTRIASQYDNCKKEIQDMSLALANFKKNQDGAGEAMLKAAKDNLRAATLAGEAAKKYGLNSKTIEHQAKAIRTLNKDYNMSAEEATELAIANQRMNKGVADLNKNFKTWHKTLTTADKASADYADAVAEIEEAIGNLTGASDDFELPEGFLEIPGMLEKIEAASNGDVLAINEIGIACASAAIDTMQMNDAFASVNGILAEDFQNAKDLVIQGINDITNNLPALLDGTMSIDQAMSGSANSWVDSLNQMALATGMSVEQMNGLLNQLGVQAKVDVVSVPQQMEIPTYDEYSEMVESGSTPASYKGPDGEIHDFQIPKYHRRTWSVPGPTITTEGYAQVAQISTTGGSVPAPAINYTGVGGTAKGSSGTPRGGGVSPSSTSPGGKGGGGSNKSSKPTAQKQYKDVIEETDRYHTLEKQLEQLTNEYDKVSKAKDRLYGKNKIKAIKEEIEALNKLIKHNQTYLSVIDAYLKKDEKNLKQGGLTRDYVDRNGEVKTVTSKGVDAKIENGVITNYAQLIEDAVKIYNEAVDEYNKAVQTADKLEDEEAKKAALELAEDTFKEAELQYEMVIEAITAYEDTVKAREAKLEEIRDEFRQQQDAAFEDWSYKLELKIKINDEDLRQLDYYRKHLERFAKDTWAPVTELLTIWNGNGNDSDWKVLKDRVSTLTDAADSLLGASHGDPIIDAAGNLVQGFDFSEEDWMSGLDNLEDNIYDTIDALYELDETMTHYYAETLTKAEEKLDQYMQKMEDCTAVLKHYQTISELLGKEKNYEWMGEILDAQHETIRNELESATHQFNLAKAQYDKMKEDYENSKDQVDEGTRELMEQELQAQYESMSKWQDKMLLKTEEYAEASIAIYENMVNKQGKVMEDALTNGQGFDSFLASLDRVASYQELLLTKTNQVYETNKLMHKLSQDIDKTDSVASKNKLSNFKKEIADMQNMNEMSKFDLDVANARYEVLKAQIALEEAQNAKSTVRLQRDNEGNYGYVYTADRDKIDNAEQELANKQNDLYNLTLNKANENAKALAELDKEMYDELKRIAIEYRGDAEKIYEESNRVREEYAKKRSILVKDYTTADYWQHQTSITETNEAYGDFYYQNLADTESWEEAVSQYVQDIQDAHDTWTKDMHDYVEPVVGTDLDSLKGKTQELKEKSEEYQKWFDEFADTNADRLAAIQNITHEYFLQRQEVEALISKLEEYANKINNARAEAAGEKRSLDDDILDMGKDYSKEATERFRAAGGQVTEDVIRSLQNRAYKEEKLGGHNEQWATNEQLLELFQMAQGGNSTALELVDAVLQGQQFYMSELFDQLGITGEGISLDDAMEEIKSNSESVDTNSESVDSNTDANTQNAESADNNTESNENLKNAIENQQEAAETQTDTTEESAETTEDTTDQLVEAGEQLQESNEENATQIAESNEETAATIEEVISTAAESVSLSADKISTAVVTAAGIISSAAQAIAAQAQALATGTSVSSSGGGRGREEFASGGYTGSWGSEGKLAMLHEKELVLNADDTKNMLATVDMVRKISSAIDINSAQVNIGNPRWLDTPSPGGEASIVSQDITIYAEFPDATDYKEIEIAFDNLFNRASQYANRPANYEK